MGSAPITIEPLKAELPPLRVEKSGAVRVGNTRVSLEIVLSAFISGQTPEVIVDSYDTLELGDVYAVIGYYLRHKDYLDQWLAQREREADEIEKQIDQRNADLGDVRARLLARRKP
jgi:uncharacterized protein (DUF433 family)